MKMIGLSFAADCALCGSSRSYEDIWAYHWLPTVRFVAAVNCMKMIGLSFAADCALCGSSRLYEDNWAIIGCRLCALWQQPIV